MKIYSILTGDALSKKKKNPTFEDGERRSRKLMLSWASILK